MRPVSSGGAHGSVRGAHSAHVTRVAEEVGVQGEALRAGLIRQLLATLLENDGKGSVRSGSVNTIG